jgi:sulfonate transport system substrate-binding protein
MRFNALQAGETDMVQAGVPAIGAILRGMDLVFLRQLQRQRHQARDPMPRSRLIANGGAGIVQGDLKSLKGKKIATLVRHDQPPLSSSACSRRPA